MIIITTKIKNQDNQEQVYHYSRSIYGWYILVSERPTACRQTEMAVTDRNRQETKKPESAHIHIHIDEVCYTSTHH